MSAAAVCSCGAFLRKASDAKCERCLMFDARERERAELHAARAVVEAARLLWSTTATGGAWFDAAKKVSAALSAYDAAKENSHG